VLKLVGQIGNLRPIGNRFPAYVCARTAAVTNRRAGCLRPTKVHETEADAPIRRVLRAPCNAPDRRICLARGFNGAPHWLHRFEGLLALLLATAGILSADGPKTILDLQPFQRTSTIHVRSGVATLVNLNPTINGWYLLRVDGSDWHLENPKPHDAQILLDEKYPSGVVIAEGNNRYSCDLFAALEQGRNSPLIYYPLCGGRLYLRNPAKGRRTALEAATEFLRNQVWGGEKVIVLFHHLMADRYRETGELRNRDQAGGAGSATAAGRPLAALVDSAHADRLVMPGNLGIALESQVAQRSGMTPGAWYPAAGNAGIYVSVIQPNLVSPAIFQSYKNLVNNLDNVEASSLCYLIAFDLDQFDLGYALGTEHPGVNWSDRVVPQMRDSRMPGPDGIGSIAPLVSTGLISPENGRRTVATFTGGFKRSHGAFRSGDLALENHGSPYGFIENGVVFSKLQPGLATIFMPNDGSIEIKTWTEADNSLLAGIRFARQNGVPLIESGVPGRLVARWGPGNWSGSEDEKLRTIRAGAGMQQSGGKRFLIYAVFSDATPSAMARVFQAYQCNYAMLTDMNALEHTYLAVYRRSGSEMSVDHLLTGMSVLDKSVSGEVVPRFLGFPDNRDFFYVMRRSAKEIK